MKKETKQGLILSGLLCLSYIAGALTIGTLKQDLNLTPITENNVIGQTEVHYYEDGSVLSMTTIFNQDGSVDTHTEFSYPLKNDNVEEDFFYKEELPSNI